MIFSFFLILFTFSAKPNITDFLVGKWDVHRYKLDKNGGKGDEKLYFLTFDVKKKNDESIFGELHFLKDDPGYLIRFDSISNTSYNVFFVDKFTGGEDFQELIHFDAEIDFEYTFKFNGVYNNTAYVFNALSENNFMLSLQDLKTGDVIEYLGKKPLKPGQNKISVMHTLLPILPIFAMLYQQSKEKAKAKKVGAAISRHNTGKNE